MVDKAKLFRSGGFQAVRLPKDFRFDGTEVRIRRHGGAVILEPIAEDWRWLDALVGKFDRDAVKTAREKPPTPKRPGRGEWIRQF